MPYEDILQLIDKARESLNKAKILLMPYKEKVLQETQIVEKMLITLEEMLAQWQTKLQQWRASRGKSVLFGTVILLV